MWRKPHPRIQSSQRPGQGALHAAKGLTQLPRGGGGGQICVYGTEIVIKPVMIVTRTEDDLRALGPRLCVWWSPGLPERLRVWVWVWEWLQLSVRRRHRVRAPVSGGLQVRRGL